MRSLPAVLPTIMGVLLLLRDCYGDTSGRRFIHSGSPVTLTTPASGSHPRGFRVDSVPRFPSRSSSYLDAIDIKSAYGIPYDGVNPSGAITIGVVMYCYYDARAALNEYRTFNNLQSYSYTLTILNQAGLSIPTGEGTFPSAATGTSCTSDANVQAKAQAEINTDLQMVSAACPSCNILLVVADSPEENDLTVALKEALKRATVVSMSFCIVPNPGGVLQQACSNNTGSSGNTVALFASSGDWGQSTYGSGSSARGAGVPAPATYPNVISVGGTTLTHAGNARGWDETAWTGSGCGCTLQNYPRLSGQPNVGCPARTLADVSAVASNVWFFNGDKGWQVTHGTSISTPIVATIFAITGHASVDYAWPYSATSPFSSSSTHVDITTGPYPIPLSCSEFTMNVPVDTSICNGASVCLVCNAGPGYDGPTGLGVWYPVAATCASFTGTCPAGYVPQPSTTVCNSLKSCSADICCSNYGTETPFCLALTLAADCTTMTKDAFVLAIVYATLIPMEAISVKDYQCSAGVAYLTTLGNNISVALARMDSIEALAGSSGIRGVYSVSGRGATCASSSSSSTKKKNTDRSNPSLFGLLALLAIPVIELMLLVQWMCRPQEQAYTRLPPQPVLPTTNAVAWNSTSAQTGYYPNSYPLSTTAPAAVTTSM